MLVVLAVLLSPLAGLLYAVNSEEACGNTSGLTETNGECIGVSDGSFSFMPELDDVSRWIMRENARAEDDRPSATIALLGPMTARDTVTKTRILHRVQGAPSWRNARPTTVETLCLCGCSSRIRGTTHATGAR
jgi:hypothetical protein